MNPDTAGINFTGAKNYLKRDIASGLDNIAAPATSAYSGNIYITQRVISHDLGYVPVFRVYYEGFKDGILWPMLDSRRFFGATTNPVNNAQSGPYCIAWADSVNLTIELGYPNSSLTGVYPVFWIIYRDYQLQ